MSIYIMTHKIFESFTDLPEYKTLLVGAHKNKGLDGYYRDNDFLENISSKNSYYCELTGAYWMMKQADERILGLVHYRRYFVNINQSPLSMAEISQILSQYDVILPRKMVCTFMKIPCSIRQHFINILGNDGKESWEVCKRILKQQNPEMGEAFELFEKTKESYFYNMCIMKKNDFREYHQWLFKILFEVEKEINVTTYNKYNQRMFGFLSERLLAFWCLYHHKNIKEMPIVFTEPISFIESIKQMIIRKLGA